MLVVEESSEWRDALASALGRLGYVVASTWDAGEAVERGRRAPPHLAVVGMLLPGQSGFQLTERIKESSDGRVRVIMTSEHSSAAHRNFAHACGVDVFVPRPVTADAVAEAARSLCPPNAGTGSRPIPRTVAGRS